MLPLLGAALGTVARVAVRGLVAGGRGLATGTTMAAGAITGAIAGTGRMIGGAVAKNIVKNKVESLKEKNNQGPVEDKTDAVRQINENNQQTKSDASRVSYNDTDEEKNNDQTNSKASKIQILSSIADQVKSLRNNIKSYETFLYQQEQTTEAKQAERFIEEGDKGFQPKAKRAKPVKGKKEGGSALQAIFSALAVGVFAFLPLIIKKAKEGMKFLGEFYENIKLKFTEIVKSIKEVVTEYVIDPIREFFIVTIPEAWDNIKDAIQNAIEKMIDAPKSAINMLMIFGNNFVAEAIDKVVDFIKNNAFLKRLVGEKKIESLQKTSIERKEKATELEIEEEGKDVAEVMKQQLRGRERGAQRAEREKTAAGTAAKRESAKKEEAKPSATKVEPPKEGDVKPSSNGKFSDPDAFAKALFPYAKYVSDSLGGKVPPIAFLGQWAGESGSGKSLPADFNYAGIKAFGGFKKGDFVLTEERYTDAQLKRAQQSGESLYRVLDRDTKMDKGKQKVTIDEWYGKGSFDAAEKSGQHWVQVKSYFAKFDSLQDFADGYIKILKNPRYKKALESASAGEFGLQVAKAGYATASAEKYSQHISSYEQQYAAKLSKSSTGTMVAGADTGEQIGTASMAAKIEEPAPKPVVVVQGSQPTPQVASTGSAQGSSRISNPQAAQDLYHNILATARA